MAIMDSSLKDHDVRERLDKAAANSARTRLKLLEADRTFDKSERVLVQVKHQVEKERVGLKAILSQFGRKL